MSSVKVGMWYDWRCPHIFQVANTAKFRGGSFEWHLFVRRWRAVVNSVSSLDIGYSITFTCPLTFILPRISLKVSYFLPPKATNAFQPLISRPTYSYLVFFLRTHQPSPPPPRKVVRGYGNSSEVSVQPKVREQLPRGSSGLHPPIYSIIYPHLPPDNPISQPAPFP